jgi:hypothetical protein
MKRLWQLAACLFIVVVMLAVIAGEEDGPGAINRAPPPAAATLAPGTSIRPMSEQMRAMMPTDEVAVIAAVESARRQYAAATNAAAEDASRGARAAAICAALRSRSVDGWIGTVSALGGNADGKGVFAVEIASKVAVKTWTNSLSDVADKTLIEPSSPLFAAASQLHKGQMVRFGGIFFQNAGDCVREASMSLAFSIDDPEFIFRFGSVSAIE